MRALLEEPGSLVQGGRMKFGTYGKPAERANLIDAQLLGPLPLPRLAKSMRLKEWEAVQIGGRDHFISVALFNAKILAMVQVRIYDRRTRLKHDFEIKVAPWVLHQPDGMKRSHAVYESDEAKVAFYNLLDEGRIYVSFDIEGSGGRPAMKGEFTLLAGGQPPMVVCIPFGDNRGMYSHKGLMPVSGKLILGGEVAPFREGEAFAFIDHHKGYYPYVMRWDWATAAGWDAKGRLVGFNLTRNQSIDQEAFNENALWLGGHLHLLPAVVFDRGSDPLHDKPVWRIRDAAGSGAIDLSFLVETMGKVDINLGLIESRYRGPFGSVSGHLTDSAGRKVPVQDLFGMAEDFYLRC